jgi:hypothetical protein
MTTTMTRDELLIFTDGLEARDSMATGIDSFEGWNIKSEGQAGSKQIGYMEFIFRIVPREQVYYFGPTNSGNSYTVPRNTNDLVENVKRSIVFLNEMSPVLQRIQEEVYPNVVVANLHHPEQMTLEVYDSSKPRRSDKDKQFSNTLGHIVLKKADGINTIKIQDERKFESDRQTLHQLNLGKENSSLSQVLKASFPVPDNAVELYRVQGAGWGLAVIDLDHPMYNRSLVVNLLANGAIPLKPTLDDSSDQIRVNPKFLVAKMAVNGMVYSHLINHQGKMDAEGTLMPDIQAERFSDSLEACQAKVRTIGG